jgi:hypothetical protein
MQVPKFEGDVFGEGGQAAARKLHAQYKEVSGTRAYCWLHASTIDKADQHMAPYVFPCQQSIVMYLASPTSVPEVDVCSSLGVAGTGAAGLVPEAQGGVSRTTSRGAQGHRLKRQLPEWAVSRANTVV